MFDIKRWRWEHWAIATVFAAAWLTALLTLTNAGQG